MKKTIARRRTFRGLLSLPFASTVLSTTVVAWAVSSKALAATPVEFGAGSFAQMKRANAGRPWIAHFWGLNSGPCVAELPRWGEFLREHPKARVAMIHFEQMPLERVSFAFRQAGLAQQTQWVVQSAADERLRHEVDPNWHGGTPRTLLIDAKGNIVASSGSTDFAALRSWLLAQAPGATPSVG